mmetsp:Transcript_8901/g.12323  ORF Transcript_8901/g.12323 Transcript_8901/m.12323 type:complete len:539 (+) Transcript_8901:1348-2964(+)
MPLGRVRGYKSLCVDKLNRKVLYATAAGEIGEFELDTGRDVNAVPVADPDPAAPPAFLSQPLVSSHFRDQLHALCSHPFRQECVTAGDDKTLRVWGLEKRRLLTSIALPDVARAACYSPNGHIIVVGLGGQVSGDKRPQPRPLNGRVLVVSYLQGLLRIVHTAHNALDSISCVLFSPDGAKVFAASLDFNIYVYDALNNFVLLATLANAHSEGVRLLDISEDGKYLLSVSASHREVVLWDLLRSAAVPDRDKLAVLQRVGLAWRVGCSPVGLHALGLHAPFAASAAVLAAAQTHSRSLQVTGDVFGRLKLFACPALNLAGLLPEDLAPPSGPGPQMQQQSQAALQRQARAGGFFSPCKTYAAHSPGGLSGAAFSPQDRFLLTLGRTDRCLIQWRLTPSQPQDPPTCTSTSLSLTEDSASPDFPEPAASFDSSFCIYGVDLCRHFQRTLPPQAQPLARVHLTGLLGLGNHFPEPLQGQHALPAAVFCGQGQVLGVFGRCAMLLGSDGLLGPFWQPDPLRDAGSASSGEVSAVASSPCGL